MKKIVVSSAMMIAAGVLLVGSGNLEANEPNPGSGMTQCGYHWVPYALVFGAAPCPLAPPHVNPDQHKHLPPADRHKEHSGPECITREPLDDPT